MNLISGGTRCLSSSWKVTSLVINTQFEIFKYISNASIFLQPHFPHLSFYFRFFCVQPPTTLHTISDGHPVSQLISISKITSLYPIICLTSSHVPCAYQHAICLEIAFLSYQHDYTNTHTFYICVQFAYIQLKSNVWCLYRILFGHHISQQSKFPLCDCICIGFSSLLLFFCYLLIDPWHSIWIWILWKLFKRYLYSLVCTLLN